MMKAYEMKILLGAFFFAKGPPSKKHLRQCDIRTDTTRRYKPKLQSWELRYNDMP
jgi:hypothetical protein